MHRSDGRAASDSTIGDDFVDCANFELGKQNQQEDSEYKISKANNFSGLVL